MSPSAGEDELHLYYSLVAGRVHPNLGIASRALIPSVDALGQRDLPTDRARPQGTTTALLPEGTGSG
jgi:hypothetical protein